MEQKDLTNILVKISNESETEKLENFKIILEFLFKNSDEKLREQIRTEFNRLSEEILSETKSKI